MIGVTTTKVARALASIPCRGLVRLEGIISTEEFLESLALVNLSHGKVFVGISLNALGPENISDIVARDFSQADLFFQHPNCNMNQMPYKNPHFIYFPGMTLQKETCIEKRVWTSSSRGSLRLYMSTKAFGNVERMLTSHGKLCPSVVLAINGVHFPSELLLTNWIEELDKRSIDNRGGHLVKGSANLYRYHGPDRPSDPGFFQNFDIVLTTYGTVTVDFSRKRGVLDGGLLIRSSIRWCMTGTPVQNKLEDLGALIRFRLRLFEDVLTFRRYMYDPEPGLKHMQSKPKIYNLRLLLSHIYLRRKNTFTGKRAVEAARRKRNRSINRIMLDLILPLRMFCNLGPRIPRSELFDTSTDLEAMLSHLQQNDAAICSYCFCDVLSLDAEDGITSTQLTECRKLVCGECSYRNEEELDDATRYGRRSCPFCRAEHTPRTISSPPLRTRPRRLVRTRIIILRKLLKLLENIQQYQASEKRSAYPERSPRDVTAETDVSGIVFSFWKKSLDLVEQPFAASGINFCRVGGSLATSQRKRVLTQFQTQPDVRVLLMTLETVQDSTLSVANRIHLLEPQWNPSVEKQAAGRIFRLGQARKVTVVRYIVDKTIEELVESRQLQKLKLASGGSTSLGWIPLDF
ncbi:P-loop containing nucleoside triphosphate hydrolase protein [Xylariales sp. AK1849]|nr:P-loop containing nucleoside triphosphate hydrolase protein [Xylariales sp. AK1849]